MNLQEFLDYRRTCPLCGNDLSITFHSLRKQTIRIEEGRLLIVFRLDAIKKKQIDYKVGYSFGYNDNSCYVEFYTKDDKRFDNDAPMFLINRFKELDKNLLSYKFYRHCARCCCYNYCSNGFHLYFKEATTGDLRIDSEYIGMHVKLGADDYKIYKLFNSYMESRSTLSVGKSNSILVARDDWGMHPSMWSTENIETSLIKFVNKEETIDRIQKLLVFS
jgi:hypothetical protein